MSDDAARMVQAERAQAAMTEFCGPAFDLVREEYTAALIRSASAPQTPDNKAAVEKLALGIKIIDRIEGHIQALIVDGKIARNEARREARMNEMTTEEKRWLY